MLMVTALGTSPLGIIDLAGLQTPELPTADQNPTLEEYYSSDSINAATYAIVTALLLAVNLIGKDSRPSELRKAAIVDSCNRAAIALAALGTGLYWLASTLRANPLSILAGIRNNKLDHLASHYSLYHFAPLGRLCCFRHSPVAIPDAQRTDYLHPALDVWQGANRTAPDLGHPPKYAPQGSQADPLCFPLDRSKVSQRTMSAGQPPTDKVSAEPCRIEQNPGALSHHPLENRTNMSHPEFWEQIENVG